MKPDFVCACSSLEPSELTASVVLMNLDGEISNKELLVLIDDTFEKRSYSHVDNYFPNYSIANYQISNTGKEKYRATYSELDDWGRAVENAESNLNLKLKRLKNRFPSHSHSLENKISDELEHIRQICSDRNFSLAVENYEVVLKSTLGRLLGSKVTFRLYSDFLRSAEGLHSAQMAVFRICNTLTSKEKIRFLRKSGVRISTADREYFLEKFSKSTLGLVGSAACGATVEFTYNRKDTTVKIDGTETSVRQIKFEGMAVNNHLLEYANLLHLGWFHYSEETMPPGLTNSTLEVITPISNADPKRSADSSSRENLRLSPGGYTLLDYEHPRIFELVSIIVGEKFVSQHDYLDWSILAGNMPRAVEKGTKNTRQIRTYVNRLLKDEWHTDRIFPEVNVRTALVSEVGVGMRQVIRGLNQLRRYIVTGNAPAWVDVTVSDELTVDKEGRRVGAASLRNLPYSLISKSTKWREEICRELFEKQVLQELEFYNESSFPDTEPSETDEIGGWISFDDPNLWLCISRYERFLRSELFEYYALVYCLMNTLLKATPLNFLLALEREDLTPMFERLLLSRGARNLMWHKGTRSWEIV